MLAPPDAPAGVTAKVDPAGMTLLWASAGGNITEYEIQKSDDAGSTWSAAATTIGTRTSVTIGGLQTGNTFLFRVRAKNVAGNSAYTATTVGIVQTGKPSAPTGLTAIGAGTSVVLGWADANPSGALVSTFNVQYSKDSGRTWLDFAHNPSTTPGITVTGLITGNKYLFRVAAVNPSGLSEYSATYSLSLGAPTTAPSSLSGRAGNQKVTLSWAAPALGTPNINSAFRIAGSLI
jgi:titin